MTFEGLEEMFENYFLTIYLTDYPLAIGYGWKISIILETNLI